MSKSPPATSEAVAEGEVRPGQRRVPAGDRDGQAPGVADRVGVGAGLLVAAARGVHVERDARCEAGSSRPLPLGEAGREERPPATFTSPRARRSSITAAAAAPARATSPTVSSVIPPMATTGAPSAPATSRSAVQAARLGRRSPSSGWRTSGRSRRDRRRRRGRRAPRRASGCSAPPACPARRCDGPRLGRQVLVAHVDPVRPGEQRQVGPVVHDDEGPAAASATISRAVASTTPAGEDFIRTWTTPAPPVDREPRPPDRVVLADDGVEPPQAGDPRRAQPSAKSSMAGHICTSLDAPASRAYFPLPATPQGRKDPCPTRSTTRSSTSASLVATSARDCSTRRTSRSTSRRFPDVADQAVPVESEVEHVETGEE